MHLTWTGLCLTHNNVLILRYITTYTAFNFTVLYVLKLLRSSYDTMNVISTNVYYQDLETVCAVHFAYIYNISPTNAKHILHLIVSKKISLTQCFIFRESCYTKVT
jgi:cell division FtsZ-interacting protein ZapD